VRDLKVRVERIVRPIRAKNRRKMKMREELLAHLTASYEDGLAVGLREDIATRRALERFGDPAALRAELQASVPMIERVLYFSLPAHDQIRKTSFRPWVRRSGESVAHHAWRLWLIFASLCAGMDASLVLICRLAYGAGSVPFDARHLAASQGPLLAFMFIYVLLLDEVHEALRKAGSSARRAALIGGLCLLSSVLTAATCLSIRLLAGARLNGKGTELLCLFVGACVLVPAAIVYQAYALTAYQKRWDEWESLVLDN
jgi:hypothetical protein